VDAGGVRRAARSTDGRRGAVGDRQAAGETGEQRSTTDEQRSAGTAVGDR
jgi:hypothetical protein